MQKLVIILCIFVGMRPLWGATQTESKVPTSADFETAVHQVIVNEAQWRKIVDVVDIEQIPVDYAIGKRFEQNKSLVDQDLKMSALWAGRVLREHSYFAEVNFLSSVQDLQAQIQLFVSLLLQFDIRDKSAQNKVLNWTESMTNLANGPVQEVWKASYLYTTHRALLIDQTCGSFIKAK